MEVGVGVGAASPRLRNAGRSGVGDGVARSHGNETGVGVGVGVSLEPGVGSESESESVTPRLRSPASYHTFIGLTIAHLTSRPAANEATPREIKLHGRFCAQVRSLLLGSPYAELNKHFFLPKISMELDGEICVCPLKHKRNFENAAVVIIQI